MSWDDARSSARTTASAGRQVAHSDDAKHRVDEHTTLKPHRPRFASKAVLVTSAVVVTLVLVGGATAALVSGSSDDSSRSAGTARPDADPGSHTGAAPDGDPDGGSNEDAVDAVAAPMEFDTRGVMHYVKSVYGSGKENVDVAMHIDCTSGSCRIEGISGYLLPGITGRALVADGANTWTVAGRPPDLSCKPHSDPGLASATLTLDETEVTLKVHKEGGKHSSGDCYSISAEYDGTFTGPRG
jgi:hypothetical protein